MELLGSQTPDAQRFKINKGSIMSQPTIEEIRKALSQVQEPELRQDLVSLNMVKNIHFENGVISTTIELTTPACPLKDEIKKDIEKVLMKLPGVQGTQIEFTARVQQSRAVTGKMPIEGVKNVVAVYACKGGVGKSTISTNLSVSLARMGAKVGLLDADVHGPNIPMMMGVSGRPDVSEKNRITPLANFGVKVMSLGLLKDMTLPMIWRGPMVHGAIQQLLRDTEWGELDYLIVDLPPGTGDAQLTVIQTTPLSGVVFVSTPQQVCLSDGIKGINMFKKLNVPLLGLVENMSGFTCPECHHTTDIFSKGGGEGEAKEYGIPFLGAVPIDPQVVIGGDTGKPVVISHPHSKAAEALVKMSERVAANISVVQHEKTGIEIASI